MSPSIPPSCQPWASIKDDEERAEQIRPVVDQLKSAVKQMEAIPEQYMPPETKQQKEDMENQVREMEAYLAELTGETKTEPEIPPSCLPWASIEDVKERAEQIRPVADQLKSAVKQMEMIPEQFMPPETKQQKEDMEKQVHEMETYIAHLLGGEPPAPKEETPEDSTDWLVVTNEEGVLDARQEIAGVLLPHPSPIERDEAGHLILPESMAGYEGLINSGMDAGFIGAYQGICIFRCHGTLVVLSPSCVFSM